MNLKVISVLSLVSNPMTSPRSCSVSVSSAGIHQLQRNDDSLDGSQRNGEDQNSSPYKDEKEAYRVDWGPDDPENPQNWKTAYKGWLTFQLGMLALAASLGSSIISPAGNAIAHYAHISLEVATLPLSLYILGFVFGPLLWGPISEVSTTDQALPRIPRMLMMCRYGVGK